MRIKNEKLAISKAPASDCPPQKRLRAELYGGSILVDGNPDVGTTLTVTFPKNEKIGRPQK